MVISEDSAERYITETPKDLRCKFITGLEAINLQRLAQVENGAVLQEDEQRTLHRFVKEGRLFFERCQARAIASCRGFVSASRLIGVVH